MSFARSHIIEAIHAMEGREFTWKDLKAWLDAQGTPVPDEKIWNNLERISWVMRVGKRPSKKQSTRPLDLYKSARAGPPKAVPLDTVWYINTQREGGL
jgi:hypothetical protein